MKPAQVALAWVLQKKPVTAPIVGVTKLPQLTDALGALDVVLSAEDVAALEAPYRRAVQRRLQLERRATIDGADRLSGPWKTASMLLPSGSSTKAA